MKKKHIPTSALKRTGYAYGITTSLTYTDFRGDLFERSAKVKEVLCIQAPINTAK